MINEKLYKRTLALKNSGLLSGQWEREVEIGDENLPWTTPIIKAFLAEDDLQEMTLISTCIGFVKTLTKQFHDKKEDNAQEEKETSAPPSL